MALPLSGQISLSQINTELGRTSNTPNTSLRSLEIGTYVPLRASASSKPNGSAPYSMNEWHGYQHIQVRYRYGISIGFSTSASACSSVTSRVVFIESSNSYEVNIGDRCYTTESGNTVFAGNSFKWYKIDNGVDEAYAIQIDSNGVIISMPISCGF